MKANGVKTMIYIGGKPFAECLPVEIPVMEKQSSEWEDVNLGSWEFSANSIIKLKNQKIKMVYYLRRGNKYYFRNSFGRVILTLTGGELQRIQDEKMKYGTVVNMKWNYD